MFINTLNNILKNRTKADQFKIFIRYIYIKTYKYLNLTTIKKMRNNRNVSIKIHPGCTISVKMYVIGMYDYDGMSFILDHIQPDDVFFDIGSNVGPFSLLVNQITSNIHAFEGHPGTCKRLKDNFSLNGISTDKVINKVVSDKCDVVQFLDVAGYAGNRIAEAKEKSVSIESITIDEYIKNNKLPNYIKIDTEGHELNIFKGMVVSLASGHIKFISFEANGLSSSNDLAEIYEMLVSQGYIVGNIDYKKKQFYAHNTLGDKSKTGDYQALSEALKSEILSEGYEIINQNS